MTWKLYVLASAAAFVATYLMSSPKSESVRTSVSPAARPPSQSAAESEIEALADSLHVRLHSDATFQTPGRDPFSFHTRPTPPPAVVVPRPNVVEHVPAPALTLPILNLTGIATDVVDGTPRRAAVLSVPAGVLIVREGESVAGLYTVVSIGEASVELEATTDGSRRTLRLSGK